MGACSKGGGGAGNNPGGPAAKKPPDPSPQPSVPVGVVLAAPGTIISTMTFNTTVESERNVVVYPQASGLVEAVMAEEGDRVAAGQVLVQLDDDDARIAYERAQVELRKLRGDSLRTGELFRKELVSREAYESVLYQVDRARLTLEEAILGLQRTKIRAPVAGIISERKVEVGNRVSPGSDVYKLVTMDDLIAQIYVPGRTRQYIRVSQEARITSDMLPGYEIEGVIERINPVVDPQSGTVKVTVQLQDRERKFTPGMFANVALITDQRSDALLLPKEAIVYDDGRPFAFVVKDTVVRRVLLELGLTNPRQVQVLSGASQGDSVVIVGQEGLRDGAKVRVVADAFRPVPKEAATDSTKADSTKAATPSA